MKREHGGGWLTVCDDGVGRRRREGVLPKRVFATKGKEGDLTVS